LACRNIIVKTIAMIVLLNIYVKLSINWRVQNDIDALGQYFLKFVENLLKDSVNLIKSFYEVFNLGILDLSVGKLCG
jgi:hypothetical protein